MVKKEKRMPRNCVEWTQDVAAAAAATSSIVGFTLGGRFLGGRPYLHKDIKVTKASE